MLTKHDLLHLVLAGRNLLIQLSPGRPMPPRPYLERPPYHWRPRLAHLSSAAAVDATALDAATVTTLSAVNVELARDNPSPPSAGVIVELCPVQI